jgi:hypothetical protein
VVTKRRRQGRGERETCWQTERHSQVPVSAHRTGRLAEEGMDGGMDGWMITILHPGLLSLSMSVANSLHEILIFSVSNSICIAQYYTKYDVWCLIHYIKTHALNITYPMKVSNIFETQTLHINYDNI